MKKSIISLMVIVLFCLLLSHSAFAENSDVNFDNLPYTVIAKIAQTTFTENYPFQTLTEENQGITTDFSLDGLPDEIIQRVAKSTFQL